MAICDGHGLPLAVHVAPASPAEVRLVDATLEDRFLAHWPDRLIGDKAYDSDALDTAIAERNIEMIAPHRLNRHEPTQDGRPLRRYKRRWTVERSISWLQNFRRLCIRWEKSTCLFQGFLHLSCSLLLLKTVFG